MPSSGPEVDLAQASAWMRQAIQLAERAWGDTHPNPLVGSLAVIDGEVVAEGWHHRAGEAHAEIEVLRQLTPEQAERATLVVTLEPCSTVGRTGACTDAIRQAGIRQVIVGAEDPNPAHRGSGIERLRARGIAVTTGVEADACRDLNPCFHHFMETGRPLVVGKLAQTLDGKVATRTGGSKWITGPEARSHVHHWRAAFPAIGTGTGTVLADDPALTIREDGRLERSHRRLIFDRSGRTLRRDPWPRVFRDAFAEQTVLVSSVDVGGDARKRLAEAGVSILSLPDLGRDPTGFAAGLFGYCAEHEITGLWLEGGPGLLQGFLDHRLLDQLWVYRAPVFLGDGDALAGLQLTHPPDALAAALRLADVDQEILGDDCLIRGRIHYPDT